MGYVKRNVTGENIQLMTVEGNGEVYLAENAYHVTVIDLEPMDGVCVESENILAFLRRCIMIFLLLDPE